MEKFKVFGEWETDGIKVYDPGLAPYINLDPKLLPRSHGRLAKKRFGKSKVHIVERLINKVLVSGHKGKKHWRTSGRNVGKYHKAYNLVKKAFKLIEQRTKKNPVEVLVRAIENSAPREETTTIEYGGVRYPKAVDCSPQRRVDLALRWLAQGAYQSSSSSKRRIHEALAEEIILASKNDSKSFAISKKIEVERQALASR